MEKQIPHEEVSKKPPVYRFGTVLDKFEINIFLL